MQGAALTLIATVLASTGNTAHLDQGTADGLRPGDRGHVYYEISVRGERQRIDVGVGTVVEATEGESLFRPFPDVTVRPGYLVEFRVPLERIPAPALVELLRSRLDRQSTEEKVETLIGLVPTDHVVEDHITRQLAERRAATAAPPRESPPGAAGIERQPELEAARVAWIPGGTYEIGVDVEAAAYYNQTPRFTFQIDSFTIDRRPVTQAEYAHFDPAFVFADSSSEGFATGVTYSEAQRYCQARRRRLPSEFEWEVALGRSELGERAPIYEWTSSWYEAYPGNDLPEAAYGRTRRVLRGTLDPQSFDPNRRFYMAPSTSDRRVGFRCAATAAESGS